MRADILHRKTGGTVLVLDLVVMAHKASALFIAENSVITYKAELCNQAILSASYKEMQKKTQTHTMT
jgi:hypothetical protein